MTARITDVDRGLNRMAAVLAKHVRVRVGVLADEPKKESEGGASLLEVAAVHEFGAPAAGIPQRSFIRGTVDEKLPEIHALQASQARRILTGNVTPEIAVEQIGMRVKGFIQQRISAGIEPPLADSTIERKNGKTTPLIDTGQLRTSIAYQVEKA